MGLIAAIARDIESGNTFSEELARHPGFFPAVDRDCIWYQDNR